MPFIVQGKTNLKYILIVAILFTIVSVVSLFYWWQIKMVATNMPQILNIQKAAEDQKPLDMSNWKTYQNKTLGFEFRYPAEWYVKEESGRFLLFDSVTSCIQGTCPTKKSRMGFGVGNNKELLSISEWIKQNIAVVGIEKDNPFSIDNFEGIKRIYQGANNSAAILVIFSQKEKVNPLYYFETSGDQNRRILEEIIKSFKVLK
jgi:hypothetical protein